VDFLLALIELGIKIWTDLSSILSGITRVTDGQTDGRTDRILIARPRLHYMQRGKNCKVHYGASHTTMKRSRAVLCIAG